MYFTDKRMIAAFVRPSGKATYGYWVLTGWWAWYLVKREREIYRRIFEDKTPEEIFHLETYNFEIRYEDVSSVSLGKHFLGRAAIEFKMLRKDVYEFNFPSKQFNDAKRIVSHVLENKSK